MRKSLLTLTSANRFAFDVGLVSLTKTLNKPSKFIVASINCQKNTFVTCIECFVANFVLKFVILVVKEEGKAFSPVTDADHS